MPPLAALLRPTSISSMVGQEKMISTISSYIASGTVPSMIFWGPPGSGKTTLAMVLSREVNADFVHLSGVSSKKSDLSVILEQAQLNKKYAKKTIVFLDEIHRRNKAQQDALLPYVEDGTLILIGATTENPSFTVNNALLSRCKVIVFDKLAESDIETFLITKREEIAKHYPDREISDEVIRSIAELANGDLRNAINLLEAALMLKQQGEITKDDIMSAFGKPVYYDRDGEEHYNIISAVHKSLRDSDPDASCYRIQRMLQ